MLHITFKFNKTPVLDYFTIFQSYFLLLKKNELILSSTDTTHINDDGFLVERRLMIV